MRLFINKIVASSLLVAVFLLGSFMRSSATILEGEFSSLSSIRLLGLKLKKAFSELENNAERPKKARMIKKPIMPKMISDPASAGDTVWRRMKIC